MTSTTSTTSTSTTSTPIVCPPLVLRCFEEHCHQRNVWVPTVIAAQNHERSFHGGQPTCFQPEVYAACANQETPTVIYGDAA